ncbi:hypothetical protein EGR95_12580 [bacterium]|nr:hypothetical protein [bacterium]
MKVILQQDVRGQGKKGQLIDSFGNRIRVAGVRGAA